MGLLSLKKMMEKNKMRVMIYYINTEGATEKVMCTGKNQAALQKDVDITLARLGWDKKYCWSQEID